MALRKRSNAVIFEEAEMEVPDARSLENRGMAWMIGAFIFCPCHLPITLAALALLLGGTAAGALLREHPYAAGVVVTALWAAGTWRGYQLIRQARRT
jgi:hypothetical protein